MTLSAVFPGQGSQSPGMLSELAQEHSQITETFSEASDLLGYDLWDLCQNADAEKLRQTEITQPLMFVSGIAVWRVWQQLGGATPVIMAGHSLGEYTALTAAGALTFAKAVPLVALRGKLMTGAVGAGVGGMAAVIGMDDDAVRQMCEELTTPEGIVEAVNFNSPGQVVISGHISALENACAVAKERGARKAIMLPVSVPNHSSLMEPARAELADAIAAAKLRMPDIPVMQNADATIPADVEILRRSLQSHVVNPVHWTSTIQKMKELGIVSQVELGPGKVLAGLCKRIDKSIAGMPVENSATLAKALETTAEVGN
ncbi:MAG: ACP S-malonyltransferase [Pseudomonadota bacterium]